MIRYFSIPATLFVVFCNIASPITAESPLSFNRDVRPILSKHCFQCHGPDEQARTTDMRLDTREGLFDQELSPVTPGDPEASEIFLRITNPDPDLAMPPVDATTSITEAERKIIRRWIAQGASWQNHWSFDPISTPPPPRARSPRWGTNDIDAYIYSRQREQGLRPNAQAPPFTLIRRLYLDLVGLPPTMEEADAWRHKAFDQDGTIIPSGFDNLVDTLIESPQYGERWARRWLDLARYADTNGYEKDRDRNMWPYRDWVIRAINSGMPFDQFTVEQIAGDMLPNATPTQRIATGFHRNTMLNEEGGIDPLEFRFYAMTDRVATTGTTWLGLTLECVQCHTHKYDPITHREYYQLMALMNNSDEPEMDIPDPEIDKAYRNNLSQANALLKELSSHWPEAEKDMESQYSDWLDQQRLRVRNWQYIEPTSMKTNLPHLALETESIIYASGDSAKHDIFELEFKVDTDNVTAIRIEALPDPRLPNYGPGMTNYEGTIGDFFLTEFQLVSNNEPVTFTAAEHSYARNRYGNKGTAAALMIDGDIQTGWSVHQGQGQRHLAVIQPGKPIPGGHWKMTMHFGRHFSSSLGKFRLSIATDDKPLTAVELPPEAEPLLLQEHTRLSNEQQQTLKNEFLLSAPQLEKQAKAIRSLRKRLPYQRALVMQTRPAANPRPTFIHPRGEYLKTTGKALQGSGLNRLHTFDDRFPANRTGLAHWLVSPDNSLTARVTVNRHWQAFFGNGIVVTLNDFGFRGQPPTHPLLLDHLASQFVKNGWSEKWLHKYIVSSSTYQQTSTIRANTYDKDPSNTWLSRFPRTRLDAEVIRDSSLAAAGILSDKMFGPPVRPPQPEGITETAYGSPKWNASDGEDRFRRSIYTKVKRTAPFAMFLTFDAPSGESCTALRDQSNTSLQALTLLNDVMFMEICTKFGAALTDLTSSEQTKAANAFRRILTRPPTTPELNEILQFYRTQHKLFQADEQSAVTISGADAVHPAEQAAWTMVVRALYSLDETVTKN